MSVRTRPLCSSGERAIQFEFDIQQGDQLGVSEVRLWVGDSGDCSSLEELEVLLTSIGRRQWRGVVWVAGTSCLMYRFGVLARPSAIWRIRVSELSSGQLLLADSDELPMQKSYFVGSCALPVRSSRRREIAQVHYLASVR